MYLCPTFKRWKRLQVCLLLRICMCMHACITINIFAITHHLRRHRCHYDFLYHNRHHPHALRSPQPPPGRPRMEQLNNRIRSTRRMCFREQIPWNVADVDSNGDECEDGHLVPARFHIFFSFSNLLFWRALMFNCCFWSVLPGPVLQCWTF